MTVNVIWKEEEDLQKTIDICEPYSKIKICNEILAEIYLSALTAM